MTTREIYTLRVRARFEAAHALRSYEGKPEPLHGHSWVVEAELETPRLDDEGMAFDFVAVKRALGNIIAPFHHGNLNEIAPFDTLSPTTEHVARHVDAQLRAALPAAPISAVTVWEGPDCSATYRRASE
ncbi:MAG: 6-carboxytetrahydropterin synthase [Acidobacteriota bacterium]